MTSTVTVPNYPQTHKSFDSVIRINDDRSVNIEASFEEIVNRMQSQRQTQESDFNVVNLAFELLFLSNFDQEFDFYGVDSNAFKLGINGKLLIFQALKNPEDGYRSFLRVCGIVVTTENNLIFFKKPIAKVRIKYCAQMVPDAGFIGFKFIDLVTNKPILTMGTDSYDSYYSFFVFNYDPTPIGKA